MTDLDDLSEIYDATRFGVGGSPGRPHNARCGSPEHMKPGYVRVFRKGKNGKLRTVCKLCENLRRKAQIKARNSGGYSAEGYPL